MRRLPVLPLLVITASCVALLSGCAPAASAKKQAQAETTPPVVRPKVVQLWRAQIVAPDAFTVRMDTSGAVLTTNEGSRCGPTTAELLFIALPQRPKAESVTKEGMRCETHTWMVHAQVSGDVFARVICKERGEFEGRAPGVCQSLVRTLIVIPQPLKQTLEQGSWDVRPARLYDKDHPNAVEYYMPGASFWQVSPTRRTLELDTNGLTDVLIGDRAASGDQTMLIRRDATGARVIFDAYVLDLKPAPQLAGPGPTPGDLYVTERLDAQPPAPQTACTIWRFDGSVYKSAGLPCP